MCGSPRGKMSRLRAVSCSLNFDLSTGTPYQKGHPGLSQRRPSVETIGPLSVIASPKNQVRSNTGFESPCSTNGESCRFSPLWSNGPRLHGGNPIGFLPASRGGVYNKSKLGRSAQALNEALKRRLAQGTGAFITYHLPSVRKPISIPSSPPVPRWFEANPS